MDRLASFSEEELSEMPLIDQPTDAETARRYMIRYVGQQGIRVAWLQTPGSPECIPERVDFGGGMTREDLIARMEDSTLLKRLPSLAEVGNAAAFLASDMAYTITAAGVNVTSGAAVD